MKVETAIVVASLKKESAKLTKKIEGFVIKDNPSYEQLVKYVKDLKAVRQRAEEKQDSIDKPLSLARKNLASLFESFYETVDESISLAKEEMLRFENTKEDQEKKLEQDFSSGRIKKVSQFAARQAEIQTKIKGVSVRRSSKVSIISAKKIPAKFLVPNMAAIEKELKAGKTVPGCKLVVSKSIAV